MQAVKVVYEWDNVNYDYPSCGGTIGEVTSDGVVTIKHQSNVQGQSTGDVSRWQLNPDALQAIITNPDADYNQYNSWAGMLQGDGIAYIATLIDETAGIKVQ